MLVPGVDIALNITVLYYSFRSAVFNLLVIIALTAALTTQVKTDIIKIIKTILLFSLKLHNMINLHLVTKTKNIY